MARPCCPCINRVTVPVKMISRNILRYYFGYSSGVTKKFGSLPLNSIPKVIRPALYTCCHCMWTSLLSVFLGSYSLDTCHTLFVPFSTPHSPLPLKKRLRTQELKPLTPPQRFKHCEQPWKVMHCQHDYLECLQSLLAPVLSWFFFPEFLWLCPVSLSAGGLVAPGSLFRIATIPFNTKTVNYSNISDQLKTTLKCMEHCQTYYLFLTLLLIYNKQG